MDMFPGLDRLIGKTDYLAKLSDRVTFGDWGQGKLVTQLHRTRKRYRRTTNRHLLPLGKVSGGNGDLVFRTKA